MASPLTVYIPDNGLPAASVPVGFNVKVNVSSLGSVVVVWSLQALTIKPASVKLIGSTNVAIIATPSQPFKLTIMLVYAPASKPDIVTMPLTSEVNVAAAMGVPSSV